MTREPFPGGPAPFWFSEVSEAVGHAALQELTCGQYFTGAVLHHAAVWSSVLSLNTVDHISNHLMLPLGVMTTSISSTVASEEGLEAYSLMIWTLPPRRKYSSL